MGRVTTGNKKNREMENTIGDTLLDTKFNVNPSHVNYAWKKIKQFFSNELNPNAERISDNIKTQFIEQKHIIYWKIT